MYIIAFIYNENNNKIFSTSENKLKNYIENLEILKIKINNYHNKNQVYLYYC